MSTERGGPWEPCSVLPRKLEGECWLRPGTERGGIISAQGHTHTHLYTILYFTKRQQHEHALGRRLELAGFLLNLLSSSPASAGLILHGTLFHDESGQTQFLEPKHQASA